MQRHIQTLDELKNKLSTVESDWKDEFASEVIHQLKFIDTLPGVGEEQIKSLLTRNFEVGITVLRLFLGKSKDEFNILLKQIFEKERGLGKKFFKNDPDYFVSQLSKISLIEIINSSIKKEYSWIDIITERLKGGRGSAIKGQSRGRSLEDFVEDRIKQTFDNYDLRCNFVGKDKKMEAKAE